MQASATKKIAVGGVQAIHAIDSIDASLDPTERETARDVIADEPDHERARDDGEHAGRGQQAPVHARSRHRARHDRRDRLGLHRGQRAREQQLDPGEHEAEEGGDADAARDQRHQDLDEEAREGIAVEEGGLVDLARHAGDEAFQDPHRQRHVEDAMRERDRPGRIEQTDRRIEVEERQRIDRGRRHAVRQQPEEQMLVAEEAVARERVGRRQRHRDRDDGVEDDIFQRVDVAGIPALVGEDALVMLERRGVRPQRHRRDDLGVGLEAHVDEPVDRQQQEDQKQRHDEATAGNRMHHAAPSCGFRSAPALVMTV